MSKRTVRLQRFTTHLEPLTEDNSMSPHQRTLYAYCLLVTGLLCGAPSAFAQTELIVNGGFETGDFTGWTLENVNFLGEGGWTINDGTVVPHEFATATAPIAGSYDALTWQNGPGLRRLIAPVVLPAEVTAAMLSWSDRIRNFDFFGTYQDPEQEFRVLLENDAGVVIAEVYSTDPGDAPQQLGPNDRSFDLTAVLTPYAGQTVFVVFEQQDELFLFNVNVDDVSLLVEEPAPPPPPPDPEPTLIEVVLDVKPGSTDNPVNLKESSKSNGKSPAAGGVLPVAVLSDVAFDALTIDAATLVLGDPLLAGTAAPIKWRQEDVDLDGDLDLLLHFSILELVENGAIDPESTMLCLTGSTLDGTAIAGCDMVRIVPPPKTAKPEKPEKVKQAKKS